jgi:hypothetical protein
MLEVCGTGQKTEGRQNGIPYCNKLLQLNDCTRKIDLERPASIQITQNTFTRHSPTIRVYLAHEFRSQVPFKAAMLINSDVVQ